MYHPKPKGQRFRELIGEKIRVTHCFRGKVTSVREGVLRDTSKHYLILTLVDGSELMTSKPIRKGSIVEVWETSP